MHYRNDRSKISAKDKLNPIPALGRAKYLTAMWEEPAHFRLESKAEPVPVPP